MISLCIKTYEISADRRPVLVLEHRFFGRDKEHVRAILAAHMKTDKFLHAALRGGIWRGMTLRNVSTWDRVA